MEFFLSGGREHNPGTDQSCFWYDVFSSSWLVVIIYDAFRLGKYSFPVHKSLEKITLHTHRICHRHTLVRSMVANNLYDNA